ncbi:potassium/proton antiporter [Candidatus Soleaferrea massiliensis]|uniref:potassium/proton antiporter n=1 Tax=Candidatus Soleaferrea massiliensis TaxID=1470354 RepID=UPI000590C37C|nr:potassium/proton antiporter [Candidatus Soleaferrea massiliensis]
MALTILIFSVTMIICVACSKLSTKIGVPSLLLFIVLGMLFGSDGIVGIQFDDYHFAQKFCSVALIFIMFYGGFGTNWRMAKPVAKQAILLSSAGVVMTAALTGLFCHLVLRMSLLEGLLVGSVIGSTDAASVFSILRSKKLNLKHSLASLLGIESGSNDPTAYMLTVICLSLMSAGKGDNYFYMIFAQIGYGLAIGFGIAFLAVILVKKIKFESSGLSTILVASIALAAYALPEMIGGNGYLSVYITGIVLGNQKFSSKIELVHFFDGFTWVMQIFLFFSIGLLATPSKIPTILLPSVLIALFLTFVARPAAVYSILSCFRMPFKQQTLVAWSGLRGAASIVFAIYAVVSDAYTKSDIFHIVFCVALLSVAVQGTLLPILARKLDLVGSGDTVFKTFNDYQDHTQVRLFDVPIEENHPWAGCKLRDILLPPESLVVVIKRGAKNIVPNGSTKLLAHDVVVLNAAVYQEDAEETMYEETIHEGHPWIGKKVYQAKLPPDAYIVMIDRDGERMIPQRDTVIRQDDLVVMNLMAPEAAAKKK